MAGDLGMHQAVVEWARAALPSPMVQGKTVLDVGSLDWNGSMRDRFLEQGVVQYHGIDILDGANVDEVVSAEDLVQKFGSRSWDIVLSLEMLEHAENWQECLYQMKEVIVEGGWLVLTTRSPGYGFHAPPDYWRYSEGVIRDALSDMRDVETWSDPGHFVPEDSVYALEPGIFVRAQRVGPVSKPTGVAEPALPEPGRTDD